MSISRALLVGIAAWAATGNLLIAMDGQPTQQLVQIGDNGLVTLTGSVTKIVSKQEQYTLTEQVPQTVTKTKDVNGQLETYTESVLVPVQKTATRTVCFPVCAYVCSPVDLETVKGFEVDGRRIADSDLARRLKDKTLVVVSPNEEMISSHYASIYKLGTVILAVPKPKSAAPSLMPGSPALPAPTVVPQTAPPLPAPQPAVGPQTGRFEPLSVQPVAFQPAPVPAQDAQAVPAVPNPAADLPASPEPTIVFVSRTGADDVNVRQLIETPSVGELTVHSGDSATARQSLVKTKRITRHSETTTIPLKVLRISTGEGKDVVADRIKEKLGTTETTALLSFDGKPVDEFWLQNIKPTTLVLRGVTLPPVYAGGPTMSQPMYSAPSPVFAPAAPAPQPPAAPVPVPTQPQ